MRVCTMLPRLFIQIMAIGLGLLFTAHLNASQADLDAEIKAYISVFESNNFQQQRRVMDKLIWAGISSPKLYDVLETKLLDLKNADSKAMKEKAAWYAKTLALSGNEKYRASLQDMAANADAKKVRKNAKLGLQRLTQYQQWNPVISAGLDTAPDGQLEEFRVKNMLAASDYGLLRIGAKRVYHGHKNDDELITIARKRLESEWTIADGSNEDQIDAIAWLIKVMAESGNKQHKPLLDQIAAEADAKKVRKYAKKYADYLL